MLYTSQNKLFHNMEQYSITKGFRESTVYAQSFQVACQGDYSKTGSFRESTVYAQSFQVACQGDYSKTGGFRESTVCDVIEFKIVQYIKCFC